MILSTLVSLVQQETNVPREVIVSRARQAWPNCVDFKDVQARLLTEALTREISKVRPINRVLRMPAAERVM